MLEKSMNSWSKTEYHCQEDAANQLKKQLATATRYHELTGEVKKTEKVTRRPGRPSKKVTAPPTEIIYTCHFQMDKDEKRVNQARKMESTFVLISNASHEKVGSCAE